MRKFVLTLIVASLAILGGCAVEGDNSDSNATKIHVSREVRFAAILGCKSSVFASVGTWNLDKRPDIGKLRLFKTEETGTTLWCATTTSGSRTNGRWKYSFVQIAWYKPGDDKVEWPQAKSRLVDGDQTKHYVGGMAVSIPAGQCLAVRGFMVWKGHEYWHSVMTDECN